MNQQQLKQYEETGFKILKAISHIKRYIAIACAMFGLIGFGFVVFQIIASGSVEIATIIELGSIPGFLLLLYISIGYVLDEQQKISTYQLIIKRINQDDKSYSEMMDAVENKIANEDYQGNSDEEGEE